MNTLTNFLKPFKTQTGQTATHTRIGCETPKIWGGAWTIPDEKYDEFMDEYYSYVINSENDEYMTEAQVEYGPLCVDLDFRYEANTTKKQHDEDNITDIMVEYAYQLDELLVLPENVKIEFYIMEKKQMKQDKGLTKDGIHIMVNINLHTWEQVKLREMMLPRFAQLWDNLPLKNTWADVIDKGIAERTVNWNMYGSKKPNCEAYKLKRFSILEREGNSWEIKKGDLNDIDIRQFSARNTNRISCASKMTPPSSRSPSPERTINSPSSYKPLMPVVESEVVGFLDMIDWTKYAHFEHLKRIVSAFANSYKGEDMKALIHNSVMKNTQQYNDIQIDGLLKSPLDQCKLGTLKYYAKLSNPSAFKTFIAQDKTIDPYDITDYGRAKVYLALIGDDFQYRDKRPYIYNGRLWRCDADKEQRALSKNIQEVLIDFYSHTLKELTSKIATCEPSSAIEADLKKKHGNIMKNLLNIKSQSQLKSCRELVLTHADESNINFDMIKPYYFVFKNTAFDFETRTEVNINKYDYITQSADYNYIPPNEDDITEINNVLKSILPSDDTRKSFMSCLRTGCIGLRIQKFIMMTGRGRNGKGLINQLMKVLLGSYFYQGNITSITEKIKSGGNPEVANMDKKRMVVYGEPEDNQKLMLGAIKALTGEDTINARKLFENGTETNLFLTLFLEVNGKPNICGKIGDAIRERFILYSFPNLFTSDESLIDNITKFKQNKMYEKLAWRERMRHALFYLLLNLKGDNNELLNDIWVNKEITSATTSYLESKDEISNWVDEEYKIIDDITFKENPAENIVSMKDMYSLFKTSEMFLHSSKEAKRVKYAKKGFEEEAKENIKLKLYYIERKEYNKKTYTNCFIRMKQKTEAEKAEDKGEEPSLENDEEQYNYEDC